MSSENEDLTTCDVKFEFDAEVINSGPYRGAIVSTMKQVLYSEQKTRKGLRSKFWRAKDSESTRSSAQSLLENDIAFDQENKSNIPQQLPSPSFFSSRPLVMGRINGLPVPKVTASAEIAKCSEQGYPSLRKSKLFQHALEPP